MALCSTRQRQKQPIFIRDPRRKVDEDQLNGGAFVDLSEANWRLIEANRCIEYEEMYYVQKVITDSPLPSTSKVY